MARMKTDYSKGSIYKIVCRDNNIMDCYVGSTTNLTSRKCSHRKRCNDENDTKHYYQVYKFIRDTGGWDNWNFVLIEHFSCKDNDELRAREQYHYKLLNTTLNSRPPLATDEYTKERITQYKLDNQDKIKQWRIDNQKTIKANKLKYYRENREMIVDRQTTRYNENKTEILAKNAIYREVNRDKILARRRELYKNKINV